MVAHIIHCREVSRSSTYATPKFTPGMPGAALPVVDPVLPKVHSVAAVPMLAVAVAVAALLALVLVRLPASVPILVPVALLVTHPLPAAPVARRPLLL